VAIEELAGVDVLRSDRTGTLAQDRLTRGGPFAVGKVLLEQVIVSAGPASLRRLPLDVRMGVPRGYIRLGPVSTMEPFERPGATDEGPVRVAPELNQ
jgi:magnesium-transporting ATPase (P-type)